MTKFGSAEICLCMSTEKCMTLENKSVLKNKLTKWIITEYILIFNV